MPAYCVIVRSLAIPFVLTSIVAAAADLERVSPEKSQFRRPAAIARLDDSTAVVANRCGTLSIIDLEKFAVVSEYRIGGRLTDVAAANGLSLVTDSENSRLCLVRISRNGAEIVSELRVPSHPLTVQVAPDGRSCSVASKWARKLTFVSLDKPAITATIDLGFSPGEQLYIPGQSQLLVADAFNDRIAVVDTAKREVSHVHKFGAHNIRGLAISSDGNSLLVSHQILNDAALPRRSDIVWGVMVNNLLRSAKLDDVLNGKSGAMYGGLTVNVGYAGQGAGDPDTMFVDESGRAVMALAGVDEVLIGEPASRAFQRIGVGRRPIDLLPLSEGRFVVVNELSDSLTLIDMTKDAVIGPNAQAKADETAKPEKTSPPYDDEYEDAKEYDKKYGDKSAYDRTTSTYGSSYQDADIYTSHLSLGPTPDLGPAERGEQLFFSARLSHASWFSCHSCHVEGHTNGGTSDTFGDDTEGAPKRVLSLLGVGETGPWGWNGKKSTLPKQIHQSAASTMRGRGVSDESAADLAAFLKTLSPPPPFEPVVTAADRKLVEKGRRLFESLSCTDCHTGPTLTSADVYDVGLKDQRGLRHFNPPTLRGVGYREKLFHDKSAHSLEEVFTKHKHQLERQLTPAELSALLRYIRSL
ncbi:MAG: mono/diheme cytochrome c family protein [Planctomycetaceae bacterium]|jgi:mono/diheme cytochrome c family protein